MMLYVGMIAYNEEVYIQAALKSIYSIADRIFVVDGSCRGPSTDHTVEQALSVGPKVNVVSGMFKNNEGEADHTVIQRRVCLSMMNKHCTNWCVLVDADEVFPNIQALLLRKRLEELPVQTEAVTYNWVHLWGDFDHYISGGKWSKPKEILAFRLSDGITQLTHNRLGFLRKDGELSFAKAPRRVLLEDIMFYHYGQVVTREKKFSKLKYYLERGDYISLGYKQDEWERYEKEVASPQWEIRFKAPGVAPFMREHPESMREIISKSKQANIIGL